MYRANSVKILQAAYLQLKASIFVLLRYACNY
jgi:hypothetical protein